MGLSVGSVIGLRKDILRAHDARVVDDGVERRVVSREPGRDALDVGRVLDVECDGGHAGVGGGRLVQQSLAAPGDDDLIAEGVERLSERAADARAAAGDENVLPVVCMGSWMLPGGSKDDEYL